MFVCLLIIDDDDDDDDDDDNNDIYIYNIIIICPTLHWLKFDHARLWIKHDDKVWIIESKDNYISGQKSCHNCLHVQQQYLSSMMLSL